MAIVSLHGEFSGFFNPRAFMIALGAVALHEGERVSEFFVSLSPPTAESGINNLDYWKPRLHLLQSWKKTNLPPNEGIPLLIKWVLGLVKEYGIHSIICESHEQAMWIDYYITTYGNAVPLGMWSNGNIHTGWPRITNEMYRGILGLPWMKDGMIDELVSKYRITLPEGDPLHPTHRAWINAILFSEVAIRKIGLTLPEGWVNLTGGIIQMNSTSILSNGRLRLERKDATVELHSFGGVIFPISTPGILTLHGLIEKEWEHLIVDYEVADYIVKNNLLANRSIYSPSHDSFICHRLRR